MVMRSALTLFAALLASPLQQQHLASAQCSGDCSSCSDSSGKKWDLSKLAGPQTTTSSSDSFTYQFDVCADIDPLPDICNTYGVYGSCAVQYDDDPYSGSCTQLGPDLNAGGAPTLTLAGDTLQMKFEYGSDSLTVDFKCSKGAGAGKPGDISANGQDYAVDWPTDAVCTEAGGGGGLAPSSFAGDGDFGKFFLIGFCLIVPGYFAGGVYYNRRSRGYEGSEAIPNIELWRQVPGLIADGVVYTMAKIREKNGGPAYERPDHQDVEAPAPKKKVAAKKPAAKAASEAAPAKAPKKAKKAKTPKKEKKKKITKKKQAPQLDPEDMEDT